MGCKQCCRKKEGNDMILDIKQKRRDVETRGNADISMSSIPTMLTQHILRIKPKNDTGSKKKEDVNIFKFEEIGIHNRSQTMPKVNNSEGTESPDDILLGLKFMPPKFLSNDENIDVAINLAMPKSLTTVAGKHKKRIHVKIENFRHQKTGSVTQHYNILEHLGKGGFGIVKKVEHKSTKQIRALKIISRDKFIELDPTNEFEILKQLDHPNILKFYEYYQDQKNYYLIMELCLGGELFKRICKNKIFSERQSAYLIFQILSAISYCHDKNIVHRDIKPENLLLENDKDDSNLKVIDFGASRIYKHHEELKEKFGTPYYVAPEVLKGQYNEKCDLWSVGVILYILFCGYPPFNGKQKKIILKKVKKGSYTFQGNEWMYITREAKEFIQKLLIYDPEKRISARDALAEPWLTKMTSNVNEILLETALLAFNNLSRFSADQRLQEAVLAYMATHMQDKKEEEHLLQTFHAFDTNKDGFLSRDELIQIYTQLFEDVMMAEIEVGRIIEQVDLNNNGLIDYSEFLMANATTNFLLSDQKLRMAFQEFDLDGNGEITLEELKAFFGGTEEETDDFWKGIIAEVDKNGDGTVNYGEFKGMMQLLCEETSPFCVFSPPPRRPKTSSPLNEDIPKVLGNKSVSFENAAVVATKIKEEI